MDTPNLIQTVGWLALVLGGLFVIGLLAGAWLLGRPSKPEPRDTEEPEDEETPQPLLGVVRPPEK